MKAILQQVEKTQIVIYKSTIEKARNILKDLEKKQEDPVERAKRVFHILENLKKH